MGEMRQYLSSSRLHDALRDNCLSCGANGDRQGTLDVLCVMVFLTVRNVLTAGDRHGSSAARDRNPIRGIRPGGTGENPLLLVLLQIPYPGKEANIFICDECVDLCNEIVAGRPPRAKPPSAEELPTERLLERLEAIEDTVQGKAISFSKPSIFYALARSVGR